MREILATADAHGSKELAAWKRPQADFRRLLQRDYVRYLRRGLGYRQLRALIAAASEVWPRFNREPLGTAKNTRQLSNVASELRLHLKATPYTGQTGLALRGFYVDKSKALLHRPLIYLNTAHHPLAVSATFCHEVGHHLSTEVLEPARQKVLLYFNADYSSHLDDSTELAADAVVSLGAYPEPIARKIFAEPVTEGLIAKADRLTSKTLAEIRNHMKQRYGFDVPAQVSPAQNLHYLGGMIHYAKLRWALLAEFDV